MAEPESGDGAEPPEGVVLRPEAVVLPDAALVPESNVARPVPTELTHELVVDEPFSFDRSEPGGEPDGIIPAGTGVVLLRVHGDRCRIADGSGLSVDVRRSSVRRRGDAT